MNLITTKWYQSWIFIVEHQPCECVTIRSHIQVFYSVDIKCLVRIYDVIILFKMIRANSIVFAVYLLPFKNSNSSCNCGIGLHRVDTNNKLYSI